jgi:hypothetical protein
VICIFGECEEPGTIHIIRGEDPDNRDGYVDESYCSPEHLAEDLANEAAWQRMRNRPDVYRWGL